MTDIGYAKSLKALVKGARTLLVLSPSKTFSGRTAPKLFGKKVDGLLADLAKDHPAGDLGSTGATLVGKDPHRLVLGNLPEKFSRHASPARAEPIRRAVDAAGLGSKGKAAILLVLDDAEHVTAAVNAVGRALPLYTAKTGKKSTLRVQLFAVDRKGQDLEIPDYARSVLAATRDSAELVDTPPTDLNPKAYAARVKELLKPLANVKVTEVVGDKLAAEGLNGIHTVGRAAEEAPRMVVATYTPAEPSGRHVALVGKGITYDTGGLNLKISGSMSNMKCDMGGSAAVLGAFRVLAEHACPHQVTLLMMLAENAIGPAAYKPDDIIHMHSGKTVEINNTDAEGRLLLADGVSYASRTLGCDTVFDAATLTGAQLITTGRVHGAVFCSDADLERGVIEASYRSGDVAHPMLFSPELFKQEFKSKVADMCNSVRNRMNAQSSCAGQFVYWHMADTKAAWCQIDLAGPAFPDGRGTGYGVALLADAVMHLEG